MPLFKDSNGAIWSITTIHESHEPTSGGKPILVEHFEATIADSSDKGYTVNATEKLNEPTFPQGTTLTWPIDDEPVLRGLGNSKAAIEQFVRNYAQLAKKEGRPSFVPIVPVEPPGKGGAGVLLVLALVAFIIMEDK